MRIWPRPGVGSGAPLNTEVPPIPELPMQVSDGKLAAAAAVPEPDAVARHDDTAADSGTYAPPPDPEGNRSWLGNSLAGRAGLSRPPGTLGPRTVAPAARSVTGGQSNCRSAGPGRGGAPHPQRRRSRWRRAL